MTVMEDKIMNTILSDEELLNYVERLVAKRLPAGPHLKSDIEWYKQVIDLSINQAFEELQVVETLNYQISQLGKYLKKKSQEEIDYSRANQDSDVDTSYGERHSVEHPSFSSSEPVQRTRKPRKELPNKMVNIPNDEQTDKQLQKQAYRIQMQQQKKEDRQNQINGSDEIDKITSNLKLQHALDLANRCISSDELSNYNDLYPELSDLPSRERFDTIDEPLRPSMSYANELNNLSQSTNLRNIEENNENNFILRVPNNNQTLKDQNQNQNQNQNQSRNNTARYSNISSGTESLESYNLDPYLHHEENNKSALLSSTGGFASSKELKKIGRKDFNYTNTDDFIVFQEPFVEDYIKDQSTESINYSSHLGHIGHAGINENFHGGSQADTVAASDYGIATDSENEIDHEIDHENSHENSHNSSHEKDDHGNGYENNHQNGFNNNNIDKLNLKNGHNNINEEIIQNGASDVTSKINKKNGKKINYHIDRDDEESEERDDEEINSEKNHKKLAEILKEKLEEKDDEVSGDGDEEGEDYDETDFDEMEDKASYTSDVNGQPDTPEKQEITENTFYSNWYMPSDSITKVKFATDIISDVFIIREKHSLYEIPTLFYTHDESIQFTADYNRESLKAEAMGLTWYEWWEDRDDDDVKRDDIDYLKELELEQEHLYEDDNDDISVDINDEMSDDTDEFHF